MPLCCTKLRLWAFKFRLKRLSSSLYCWTHSFFPGIHGHSTTFGIQTLIPSIQSWKKYFLPYESALNLLHSDSDGMLPEQAIHAREFWVSEHAKPVSCPWLRLQRRIRRLNLTTSSRLFMGWQRRHFRLRLVRARAQASRLLRYTVKLQPMRAHRPQPTIS